MNQNAIVKLGDPILRQVASDINENQFGSEALHNLADKMFTIMDRENGIGLAAPQIGISKRVIVFGLKNKGYGQDIPYTILFNPHFTALSDIVEEDYEGCLSIGDLRGKVSRYKSIVYRGSDVDGKLVEREVSDLHARVFQHEYDHLNGIVFLDKISDHNSLGFQQELINKAFLK